MAAGERGRGGRRGQRDKKNRMRLQFHCTRVTADSLAISACSSQCIRTGAVIILLVTEATVGGGEQKAQ